MKAFFIGRFRWYAVAILGAPMACWAAVVNSSATSSAKSAANQAPAGDKPAAKAKPYALRATDVVFVNVINDPKISQDYKIDQDGAVSLAYLDEPLRLAGLSVNDAGKAIAKAYADQKIYVDPKVTIVVKEFAQRRINFLGQVNKPGWVLIPPQEELSLVQAFTQAGGHTRNASRYCTITRMLSDGKSQKLEVNLWAAVKDAKLDVPLQEGDTVHLGESLLGDAWND